MCRNRGQRGYRFKQAEAKAQARKAIRSKPRKLTAPLRRRIEAKLRQMRWSPENRMRESPQPKPQGSSMSMNQADPASRTESRKVGGRPRNAEMRQREYLTAAERPRALAVTAIATPP